MKMKGNKYMPYFHTSSYLKEGQTVSKNTKNNYKTCEFIFSYDVDCYSEYHSLLNELIRKISPEQEETNINGLVKLFLKV